MSVLARRRSRPLASAKASMPSTRFSVALQPPTWKPSVFSFIAASRPRTPRPSTPTKGRPPSAASRRPPRPVPVAGARSGATGAGGEARAGPPIRSSGREGQNRPHGRSASRAGRIGEQVIDARPEREDRLQVRQLSQRAGRVAPRQRVADALPIERLAERRDGTVGQRFARARPATARRPSSARRTVLSSHRQNALDDRIGRAGARVAETVGRAQAFAPPRPNRRRGRARARAAVRARPRRRARRASVRPTEGSIASEARARPPPSSTTARPTARTSTPVTIPPRSGHASTTTPARGSTAAARARKSAGPPSAATIRSNRFRRLAGFERRRAAASRPPGPCPRGRPDARSSPPSASVTRGAARPGACRSGNRRRSAPRPRCRRRWRAARSCR